MYSLLCGRTSKFERRIDHHEMGNKHDEEDGEVYV
jgi:predicted GIY-YIG superfamily endonuclease